MRDDMLAGLMPFVGFLGLIIFLLILVAAGWLQPDLGWVYHLLGR